MKKLIAVVLAATFVVGAAIPLAAKAGEEKRNKAAVAAAQAWLTLTDGGKYDASWDQACKFFRSAIERDRWVATIHPLRKSLGKVVERKLKSTTYATSLPGAPDGEYVVIQFNTVFENKKSAVETVTPMREADGKWRVSGYFIK